MAKTSSAKRVSGVISFDVPVFRAIGKVVRRTTAPSIQTRLLAWMVCVAWIFAVNHCALAGMLQQAAKLTVTATDSCPFCHTQPNSGPKAPTMPMPECCKSLQATTGSPADVVPPVNLVVASAFDLARHLLFTATARPFSISADTGPPRGFLFREVLLTRCHPAVAPPFVS